MSTSNTNTVVELRCKLVRQVSELHALPGGTKRLFYFVIEEAYPKDSIPAAQPQLRHASSEFEQDVNIVLQQLLLDNPPTEQTPDIELASQTHDQGEAASIINQQASVAANPKMHEVDEDSMNAVQTLVDIASGAPRVTPQTSPASLSIEGQLGFPMISHGKITSTASVSVHDSIPSSTTFDTLLPSIEGAQHNPKHPRRHKRSRAPVPRQTHKASKDLAIMSSVEF